MSEGCDLRAFSPYWGWLGHPPDTPPPYLDPYSFDRPGDLDADTMAELDRHSARQRKWAEDRIREAIEAGAKVVFLHGAVRCP